MAKGRRTKKQKQTAHPPQGLYTLPAVRHSRSPKLTKSLPRLPQVDHDLFAYDPHLIAVDLTKTLILSILAVATIVAIYYFRLI